jgi:hypothetical protein
MILAVKSWRLREAARAAIGAGEFARARQLAAEAQETNRTSAGAALLTVSQWLGRTNESQKAGTTAVVAT